MVLPPLHIINYKFEEKLIVKRRNRIEDNSKDV